MEHGHQAQDRRQTQRRPQQEQRLLGPHGQAEHMELKLRTFGFSADPACKKVPAQFTPEQVHLLGRMEHARWCAERWLSGWSYAPPPKDAIRHTSPYLVSWEDLDKSVQEIDFETVREIPAVLAGMEGALRPVTASEG